jgi:GntR family transcriptional regulator
MPLRLHIDPGNGFPVYLQVVDQIRRAVAIGVIRPGEQLPAVKQLASDLVVNPATISRALRELEHLGIVKSIPGRGAFIRTDAVVAVAASGARDVVRVTLEQALREARSLGVDENAMRGLIETTLEQWYRNGKSEDV